MSARILTKISAAFAYFLALWRPSLRLESSPERLLMPLILAALSVLAIVAVLVPLKISAGARFAAGAVEGNLVVHIAQGQKSRAEFEAELALLVDRLESFQEIATIELAAAPDFALTQEVLMGRLSRDDALYGGIVRLNLQERPGFDVDVEALQFNLQDFENASADDHRSWKEANARRTRQAMWGGLAVLLFVLALIAAVLNLTIRLALRMHEQTLRVLHHLGATDAFGALLFQAVTFRRAGLGGLLGAGLGALMLLAAREVLGAQQSYGAGQIGFWQWAALAWVPLMLVAFAVLIARITALKLLRQTY